MKNICKIDDVIVHIYLYVYEQIKVLIDDHCLTYVRICTYTSACMMQNAAGSCRVAGREAGGGLVLAATILRTPKWGGAAAAALSLPHVCTPQPLLALTKSGTVIILPSIYKSSTI